MSKLRIALAAALAVLVATIIWASPPESEARKKIVETAESFKGVPYVYGAESPQAFDCSGFVQYVYSHAADIDIPRNSKGQWAAGTPVDKSAAKPGDIFVFDTVGGGGPSHVAIYLGNDSIIHAISEGPNTGVVVSPITDHYFGPRYIGARYFIIPMTEVAMSASKETPKAKAATPVASATPAPATPAPAPAAPKASAPVPAPTQPAPAPVQQAPAKNVPTPQQPKAAAPKPVAAKPAKATEASEPPLAQIGFTITSTPSVVMDKIPAAAGTAIAFTITNGTGKDGVFHVFFYKADVDFKKTKILREDRAEIKAGASREIEAYTFTESGVYRLNVKTADNTQLMQRTWKVVDLTH
jgi:cell wall-associated NlpC family hydrolase